MYNNFEISLVVFMPNISTNHAITYTNFREWLYFVQYWPDKHHTLCVLC